MKKFIVFCCCISSILSCSKKEGEGGNASINGKVLMRKYDPSLFYFIEEYPATDYNVYIQYGKNKGVSNDVSTDYNGDYTFSYLYPGEYTLWVYSKDTSGTLPAYQDLVVKQTINIANKEEALIKDFIVVDN